MKQIKIKIELSPQQIAVALGNGVREIALTNGGGFKRQTAVHQTKKHYSRKGKNNWKSQL